MSIHSLRVCVEAENILEMLMTPSVWDFSIALEISTHQGVLYLDIRIRLCWQGDILNLHLAYIPVFDRNTGENMFNVSAKFFTVSDESGQIFLWALRLMSPSA